MHYNINMTYLIYIFVVVSLVGIDHYTKFLVTNLIDLNSSVKVIDGFFSLTYVQNFGAGFSIMQNETIFFYILTPICLVIFVYLLLKAKELLSKIALLLMISGTIGNFIDRIVTIYVVDFLDFNIFGWDFPIFNFADICLTIGVFLYIIIIFKEEKDAKARLEG